MGSKERQQDSSSKLPKGTEGRAVCYLQVVEDEEKSLCGEALVEFHRVGVWRRHLVVVWRSRAGIARQVLPVGLGARKENKSRKERSKPMRNSGGEFRRCL